MKEVIFGLYIMSGTCLAMQSQNNDKKPESSPSRSLPFISQFLARKSASPGASDRAATSSSSSASASPSAVHRDEQNVVRSPRMHSNSALSISPTGSRLSKTIGKRGSSELSAHLREDLAKLERNEFTLTHEELKIRIEAAEKESNPDKKRKDLEQLACAKEKKEKETKESFEFVVLRQKAADEVFKIRAHQIAIALENRLTYLNQNDKPGLQEADNQVVPIIKLYYQQKALLLRMYESEENPREYEINQYRTDLKMAPILRRLEEHLQRDPRGEKKLQEYKNAIQEEQFVPK